MEARIFDFSQIGFEDTGLVVYYGLFVTVLAYILWFRGVSKTSAGTAAAFTGIIPVSTMLFSYGILHEPFSFSHLAGVGFVIAGIVLVSQGGNTKRAPLGALISKG